MKNLFTYTLVNSNSPMGYMGAPAADYDCSRNGIGMSKFRV